MCQSIWLVEEKTEIGTMGEFSDRFGVKFAWHPGYEPQPDYSEHPREALNFCLCGIDLEKTAKMNGYRTVDHDGDPMEVHWAKV